MKHIVIAVIVVAFGIDADAQSTGYPACDKYISMVSECIRTKMPESRRAEEQQRLDHFREMLVSSIAGPALAGACEANIRREIQRDRYGCYAARAAAAGLQTACSLVTPSELQEVFATAFNAGKPANSACVYESAQSPERAARIEVSWDRGRDEMEAWRGGVEKLQRDMRKTTGQRAPVGAETVTGVGDDAFLVVAGFTPMLAARKGEAALSIRVPGATRDQLIAIVRKALQRIP